MGLGAVDMAWDLLCRGYSWPDIVGRRERSSGGKRVRDSVCDVLCEARLFDTRHHVFLHGLLTSRTISKTHSMCK